jgi:hypothetical protein
MDDKILDAADGALDGRIDPSAAKVAISAYQWRAAKLMPKVYGDKQTIDMTTTVNVKDAPDDELDARILRLAAQRAEASTAGGPGGKGVPAAPKKLRG